MRLVIILVLLSFNLFNAAAQNETRSVVEKCMGELHYPAIKKGNWDFQGVIISHVNEGIRAVRADRNIEYFIALSSDSSFPVRGSVSPDGLYFAYPIGNTTYGINTAGDDLIGVDYVHIVRTDGNTNETHRFEADGYVYSGASGVLKLPQTMWFNSDWLYYPPTHRIEPLTLVNFKTGETVQRSLKVHPSTLGSVSPDGTKLFTHNEEGQRQIYDVEKDSSSDYTYPTRLVWFPDSSAFLAFDETVVQIIDREGKEIDTVDFQGVRFASVAPNGLMFALWDNQNRLFIANIEQRILYDLCFEANIPYAPIGSNLAWSPDSQALAFSNDSELIILDIETYEAKVINHYTDRVIAWVSLE